MKIKKFKAFNENRPDYIQDQIDDVVGFLSISLKETEKSIEFCEDGIMLIKFNYSDNINYEELVSIRENDRILNWKILDYVIYEKEYVCVLVAQEQSINYIRKLLPILLNIKYDRDYAYGWSRQKNNCCSFKIEDHSANLYIISLIKTNYENKTEYDFKIDLEKMRDDNGNAYEPDINYIYKLKNEYEKSFNTEIELITYVIKTTFSLDLDPNPFTIR